MARVILIVGPKRGVFLAALRRYAARQKCEFISTPEVLTVGGLHFVVHDALAASSDLIIAPYTNADSYATAVSALVCRGQAYARRLVFMRDIARLPCMIFQPPDAGIREYTPVDMLDEPSVAQLLDALARSV